MIKPATRILDARRLLCPMPVIKTQDMIKTLKPGDTLQIECTDPGVLNDIPAWARINGHQILETREDDFEYIVILQVGSGNES